MPDINASAINTNAIKIRLANGVNSVLSNSKAMFSNGPKIFSRKHTCWNDFDIRVFDHLISAERFFAKAL